MYCPKLDPKLDRGKVENGPVVVFSSDKDLAVSLTMLFENRFVTVMETEWSKLLQLIHDISPRVLVVDLPSMPAESLRQLVLLKQVPLKTPIILLRNYKENLALDSEILKLGAFVFFKPLDVNEITELISELIVNELPSTYGGRHESSSIE